MWMQNTMSWKEQMLPFRTKLYFTMQLFLSDLTIQNNEHFRAEKHCNRTGTGSCYIHPGRITDEVQILLMAIKGKFKVIIQNK